MADAKNQRLETCGQLLEDPTYVPMPSWYWADVLAEHDAQSEAAYARWEKSLDAAAEDKDEA